MCRGYVGDFQKQCFWLWSPAGSQAVDPVVWPISALGLGWLLIPHFGSVHGGSQPLIPLRTHPRFQLWAPSPLIWEHATRLQVSTGPAYPVFTVQGLRG